MKYLLVLCLLYVGSNAQIVTSGNCPTPAVQKNFDLEAYLGTWYEIHRYENTFQVNGDCVTATYSPGNDSVIVQNRAVRNATAWSVLGTAVVDPNGAEGEGKLLVNFPDDSNALSPYWVLTTDYTDYSLVFSCEPLPGPNRAVFSWILSRSKTLSPTAVLKMNEIIAQETTLSWTNFRQTSQTETSCRSTNEYDE